MANIFSNCTGLLTTGCVLYTAVGVTVPDGYYISGGTYYHVTGGSGVISNVFVAAATISVSSIFSPATSSSGSIANNCAFTTITLFNLSGTGVGQTQSASVTVTGVGTTNAPNASSTAGGSPTQTSATFVLPSVQTYTVSSMTRGNVSGTNPNGNVRLQLV